MMSAFRPDPSKLMELLDSQAACFRKLHKLADCQHRLVADDDGRMLLRVLSERQSLVDELTRLNEGLAPYRESWTRIYRGLDAATQRSVKATLEETNGLLAAVMSSDRQDAELLGARRQATSAALTRSRATGAAAAAYAAEQAFANAAPRAAVLAEAGA